MEKIKKWKIRFCQDAISVGVENIQTNPGLYFIALHIYSVLPNVQIRNMQGKKQRLVHFPMLSQNQLWMTYPASQCLWLVKTHFLQLRNSFAQLGVKEEHSTQKICHGYFMQNPQFLSELCAQKCGKVQWLLNWHPHCGHCGHSGCADSSTSLTEVDCTELLILILNRSLLQLNAFSWKNTLQVSI